MFLDDDEFKRIDKIIDKSGEKVTPELRIELRSLIARDRHPDIFKVIDKKIKKAGLKSSPELSLKLAIARFDEEETRSIISKEGGQETITKHDSAEYRYKQWGEYKVGIFVVIAFVILSLIFGGRYIIVPI